MSRFSERTVGSVAPGLIGGMLAVAERNAPGLLDGEDQGAEVGASVRAAAIGLPIGLSTSTPGIATRLEFEHGRFLVG